MKPTLILLAGLAGAPALARDLPDVVPDAAPAGATAVLPAVLPPDASASGVRVRHVPVPAPGTPRPPRRGEAAAEAAPETETPGPETAVASVRPLPRPAGLAAAAVPPPSLDDMIRGAFRASGPWALSAPGTRPVASDKENEPAVLALAASASPSFGLAALLAGPPEPVADGFVEPMVAILPAASTDPVTRDLLSRYADVIPQDAEEARRRVAQLMTLDEETLDLVGAGASAVRVTDGEYRTEVDPSIQAAALPGSALSVLLQSDKGRSIARRLAPQQVVLLGQLQPAQVNAATMTSVMAGGLPAPVRPGMVYGVAAPMPQVAMAAPAPLEGIPSLDYRGPAQALVAPSAEALPPAVQISAADVPSGSSPFAPPVDPSLVSMPMDPMAFAPVPMPQAPVMQAPVAAGDGTNLLLSGWKVALTGTGTIGMFRENDPGSVIELDEDMVVGALGRVREFGFENEKIVVTFDSGEEITGPISTMNFGGQG